MSLLSEKENHQILEFIRNTEFKDDRRQVPSWSLRCVCAFISLVFFVMTPVLYLQGRGVLCVIPLLLAVCWLLVGIVFHVQWLRYIELAACKSAFAHVPEDEKVIERDR